MIIVKTYKIDNNVYTQTFSHIYQVNEKKEYIYTKRTNGSLPILKHLKHMTLNANLNSKRKMMLSHNDVSAVSTPLILIICNIKKLKPINKKKTSSINNIYLNSLPDRKKKTYQ